MEQHAASSNAATPCLYIHMKMKNHAQVSFGPLKHAAAAAASVHRCVCVCVPAVRLKSGSVGSVDVETALHSHLIYLWKITVNDRVHT